jgi:hypothetical protein
MKKAGINKIGIIYNLDVSSGPGTHWVGMYIDNKNNEINYYDSYGFRMGFYDFIMFFFIVVFILL